MFTPTCLRERVDPRPSQHLKQRSKRQSDYVRVAAVDGFDEHGADALHGVRAGLVERLAGADVPLDLLRRERQHAHFRLRDARVAIVALRVLERDAGVDDVRLSGDRAEHPRRVGRVDRLLEQLDRRGARSCRRRSPSATGCAFASASALSRDSRATYSSGASPSLMHLGHIARQDIELEPDRGEQLAPPRRRGGEDEFHAAESMTTSLECGSR